MTIQKKRARVARFFAPGRCGVGTKSQLLGSKVGLQAALFCSPYAVVPAREGDGRLALDPFDFVLCTSLRVTQGQGCNQGEASPFIYITYS